MPDELSDVLSEFARTMVTDFPIERILDHLARRIVDVMPITAAGVTLISPGSEPRYVAASSDTALRFERVQTELDEGPCLAAYRTGEAVSVPDLRSEERFARFSPRAVEAGMAAVFAFPLRHGDSGPLGALDLYRDVPGALSTESMEVAQTLADVAAAYLINAQARSDLQDSSARSREASLHDPLTGLPNRVLLLERLRHAGLRGSRSHKISVLLYIDLDRFKVVNDIHGHGVGDELLVAVARRLAEAVRPGDTLARLSGDEFAILCEDLANASEADAIVARVGARMARPFTLSAAELTMTASIGIALTGRGADAPEELLHDADLAMYKTKREADGRLQAPDRPDLKFAEHHDGLGGTLPGAIERGELSLAYQPIVAAADGRITSGEALLRWTHPTWGPVPPTVAIPLAERTGLIVEIGKWVLERAWADQLSWQGPRSAPIPVSVNVSVHQLMAPGFTQTVAGVLETSSTDPSLLTLEVTESVFVQDANRALIVLNELKNMGVMLALDDFGIGYSSLSYLMKYPVDLMKVDRAFITNVGREQASTTIVASLVHLAHGLGMSVVSEGVETSGQHRHLNALGCDSCQGFYFARPMPASSFAALVEQRPDGSSVHLPSLETATTT